MRISEHLQVKLSAWLGVEVKHEDVCYLVMSKRQVLARTGGSPHQLQGFVIDWLDSVGLATEIVFSASSTSDMLVMHVVDDLEVPDAVYETPEAQATRRHAQVDTWAGAGLLSDLPYASTGAEQTVAIDIEQVPDWLEAKVEALKGWHRLGHSHGCQCKPCLGLRRELAEHEILDMVYI